VNTTDICILGAGIVGLTVAYQLTERHPSLNITIIDKEPEVGKHSSGRNSGVLHAGLYYQPNSLKAKVCVKGAKRLRRWCETEKIPILSCGKIITPQKIELDEQLEVLLKRGQANGAIVELIDQRQFDELAPDGRTSSGRALWSPDTCVVKPILVIQQLQKRLEDRGVNFIMSQHQWRFLPNSNQITISGNATISYAHLFNCTGLQADRVAHKFSIGDNYTMLPFKGNYWQLRDDAPFKFSTNLYPVPDLDVPFLGVHVTPSIDGATYLGPTATPALGRENYTGFCGIEPVMALEFMTHMAVQMVVDKRMRRYVYDQAFEWLPHKFLQAAQSILPRLEMQHIKRSAKTGIRPQLYDLNKRELVQDFVMLDGEKSTHIINAISPAFTASFELADHILDNSRFD